MFKIYKYLQCLGGSRNNACLKLQIPAVSRRISKHVWSPKIIQNNLLRKNSDKILVSSLFLPMAWHLLVYWCPKLGASRTVSGFNLWYSQPTCKYMLSVPMWSSSWGTSEQTEHGTTMSIQPASVAVNSFPPWTKWPYFRRGYFQMHFCDWKVLYFD